MCILLLLLLLLLLFIKLTYMMSTPAHRALYLVVLEAHLDVRVEALHVLLELRAGGVREGAHRQHRLLVHSRRPASEDAQEHLHHRVGKLVHHVFGLLLRSELLYDHLQCAAEQSLEVRLLLLGVVAQANGVVQANVNNNK